MSSVPFAAARLHRPQVALRRFLVRHPSLYWITVALVAATFVAAVVDHALSVDARREAWGDTVPVLVAEADLAPGTTVTWVRRDVPVAMVPRGALAADPGEHWTARRGVGRGEILTTADVGRGDGIGALVPAGSLAVPIVESTPSGAVVGDRVVVVSAGLVVSADVTVVRRDGEVTVIAVPAADAPAVPAAAAADGVTLLLVP